ncbi:WecB/TagA/CpsF family glycosyltransferase [Bacillus sp. T3]|uniref:WecB/TagA/CpsF family glycosyltransferase n=1 Tax=Bacillus sp. T3 TaxID=467262 RepID=UPI002981BC7D|nr:WecB/TagA/CpsF family glycosyltransferase [Bacillus sp. T3]
MDKVDILGIKVSCLTSKETFEHLVTEINNKRKQFVVTANPEIISYAYKNKKYLNDIQKADIITADGIGVVKGAKLLGHNIPERVTGIDIFYDLLKESNNKRYSIYLLGAEESILMKTIANIKKTYPNVNIIGYHHGYFDWNDDETIVNEIKENKPDLIFVALGYPLQEQWIARHLEEFNKGVFIGVGGSFDVIAGVVKRAPKIWQKMNLEWFYRLMKKPTRLKRVMRLPQFLLILLVQRQRLRQKVSQKVEHRL